MGDQPDSIFNVSIVSLSSFVLFFSCNLALDHNCMHSLIGILRLFVVFLDEQKALI